MYVYDDQQSDVPFPRERQLIIRPSIRTTIRAPLGLYESELGWRLGGVSQSQSLAMRPRPFVALDRFRFNKHSLTSLLKAKVKSLANHVVKSWRASQPIRTIRLIGHTDDIGDDAYNLKLGKLRADAVKTELEDAIDTLSRGLAKGPNKQVFIDTDTRGKKEPVTLDRSKRELNRRVEVFFPVPLATPMPPPPPRPAAPQEPAIDVRKLPPGAVRRLEEEAERAEQSRYFRPIPPGPPGTSARARAREKARDYLRSRGVPNWAAEKALNLAEKGLWSGVDETLKSAGIGSETREAIAGAIKAILSWSF
jgi:hypothetical protein